VYSNINKIHWHEHDSPLIFQLATKVMNMQPSNPQDLQSLEGLVFSHLQNDLNCDVHVSFYSIIRLGL
jgi:hypothetical protein